jgi:site-specific DNA-methyltransferase (adenine-specific)
MDRFLNNIFHGNALTLLRAMPTASIDAVIADPMYGVAKHPMPKATYDWGPDPCNGDPARWWDYHGPIYEECRRVLKPGGKLAWAMGCKFRGQFPGWFGGYRVWSFTRYLHRGANAFSHIWLVQTREQRPVRFPDADSLIILRKRADLLKVHPCPKAVEEMAFLVEHLSEPGGVILDCFAGIGSTLVAARDLGRGWIGCDLSPAYGRVALRRLRGEHPVGHALPGPAHGEGHLRAKLSEAHEGRKPQDRFREKRRGHGHEAADRLLVPGG